MNKLVVVISLALHQSSSNILPHLQKNFTQVLDEIQTVGHATFMAPSCLCSSYLSQHHEVTCKDDEELHCLVKSHVDKAGHMRCDIEITCNSIGDKSRFISADQDQIKDESTEQPVEDSRNLNSEESSEHENGQPHVYKESPETEIIIIKSIEYEEEEDDNNASSADDMNQIDEEFIDNEENYNKSNKEGEDEKASHSTGIESAVIELHSSEESKSNDACKDEKESHSTGTDYAKIEPNRIENSHEESTSTESNEGSKSNEGYEESKASEYEKESHSSGNDYANIELHGNEESYEESKPNESYEESKSNESYEESKESEYEKESHSSGNDYAIIESHDNEESHEESKSNYNESNEGSKSNESFEESKASEYEKESHSSGNDYAIIELHGNEVSHEESKPSDDYSSLGDQTDKESEENEGRNEESRSDNTSSIIAMLKSVSHKIDIGLNENVNRRSEIVEKLSECDIALHCSNDKINSVCELGGGTCSVEPKMTPDGKIECEVSIYDCLNIENNVDVPV